MDKEFPIACTDHFLQGSDALQSLDIAAYCRIFKTVHECCKSGHKMLICGNGGSAATASHLVADFTKGLYEVCGSWWDVRCLSDNVPLLTAMANDVDYERVFSAQARLLLGPEDILFVISGSGNSPNVLAAVQAAKDAGATTIGLSGQNGGRLANIVDLSLVVGSHNMQIIEDVHMAIGHALFRALRDSCKN